MIGSKLLLTTNRNMYKHFPLVPKMISLNDLLARFKVIYSCNAAKMAAYSLVMIPTPCTVAGGIMSIRLTYSCAVHLLTYTVCSGGINPALSPKRFKIERQLVLTVYRESYTGFQL